MQISYNIASINVLVSLIAQHTSIKSIGDYRCTELKAHPKVMSIIDFIIYNVRTTVFINVHWLNVVFMYVFR